MQYDNLTQEQQLRLAAFQQAAPLAMMKCQQFGRTAKIEDITDVADEVYEYLTTETSDVSG